MGHPQESLPDLKEIVAELRAGGGDLVSDSRLYDRLHEADLGHLTDDGVPGWDYDPDEVAWLVAIQRCFRRLYLKGGGCDAYANALQVEQGQGVDPSLVGSALLPHGQAPVLLR